MLSEIDRLRGKVVRLENELADERTTQTQSSPQRVLEDGRVVDGPKVQPAAERRTQRADQFVFDLDDHEEAAFFEFFNSHDPQLEETRQFLLG